MHEPARKPRYRTTNWKQYNAALKARGSLTVWLGKRMYWFATASGRRRRSPKFPDASIQFCLTLKNLFGLALPQTTGLIESVLHLCGLVWSVPDFSTLCRRQFDMNVQSGKLHIGIDVKSLQIRAICVTSNNVSDAGLTAATTKMKCFTA